VQNEVTTPEQQGREGRAQQEETHALGIAPGVPTKSSGKAISLFRVRPKTV
jgi:hypothetical protein